MNINALDGGEKGIKPPSYTINQLAFRFVKSGKRKQTNRFKGRRKQRRTRAGRGATRASQTT